LRFFYKAVDATGAVRSGYRTGESREAILRLLREEGLYPFEVKTASGKGFSFRRRVGKKDLLAFTQQLSGLLDSGMQLSKAMEIITRLLEKSAIGPVVRDIHRLVQEGASFSRALETHKEVFGPLYINLVRAGENSGLLAPVLDRLARSLEDEIKLKADILSQILYPSLVTTVSVVAIFVLLRYVVPRFEGFFLRFTELPLITRVMLALSHGLTRYGLIIFVLLLSAVAAGLLYFLSKQGQMVWSRWVLRLPLLGPVVLQLNIAGFCRMLGMMLKSGVTLLDSLALLKTAIGNKVLARILAQAEEEVRKGGTLARFFAGEEEIPFLVTQMTGVGEEAGNLDDMLEKIARFYEQDTSRKIENLISLLGPVLILILTGIVFLIALAVFLPVMQIDFGTPLR
jgi:type IV pilus assembly protein PilC